MSNRTTTGLGLLFVTLGVGLFAGHYAYHHEWHTPTAIGGGTLLLLGALLIDPEPTTNALRTLVTTVTGLLPWKRGGPADGPGV